VFGGVALNRSNTYRAVILVKKDGVEYPYFEYIYTSNEGLEGTLGVMFIPLMLFILIAILAFALHTSNLGMFVAGVILEAILLKTVAPTIVTWRGFVLIIIWALLFTYLIRKRDANDAT
jgi:hypothetical protein